MFRTLLRAGLPIVAAQKAQKMRKHFKRQMAKAAGLVFALGLFVGASILALISLHGVLLEYGFSHIEATGLMAVGLALAGLVVTGIALLPAREPATAASSGGDASPASLFSEGGLEGTLENIENQAGKIVNQVGPLKMLAIAFSIGLAAASRSGKSHD